MTLAESCLLIVDCPHTTARDEGAGYPLVRTPNVGFGRLVCDGMHRVSEEVYNCRNKRAVPSPGDLIYAREAPAGNVAVIEPGEKVCLGQRTVLLRPNPCIVDSYYLAYYLLSPEHRNELVGQASGATVLHVNLADIRSLKVSFPKIDVQRRIVAVINDYYSAIDNARRQIALLEEAAMRLYREWFVVNADPKWEKGAVRKWFEVTIGRTPPRKIAANFSEVETDQKWCSIKDLQNSSIFISETAERLTKLGVDSSKIHISPPGTVFLSFKLTVGKVAITLEPMATNEAIAHFETTNRALRDYTYCYLHEFQYDTLGSTSSIGKAINSEIVRDMPFVIPDSKTMARFSETVSPIFDQIQNCVISIRALTEARNRLLPKLMSGEVEV